MNNWYFRASSSQLVTLHGSYPHYIHVRVLVCTIVQNNGNRVLKSFERRDKTSLDSLIPNRSRRLIRIRYYVGTMWRYRRVCETQCLCPTNVCVYTSVLLYLYCLFIALARSRNENFREKKGKIEKIGKNMSAVMFHSTSLSYLIRYNRFPFNGRQRTLPRRNPLFPFKVHLNFHETTFIPARRNSVGFWVNCGRYRSS